MSPGSSHGIIQLARISSDCFEKFSPVSNDVTEGVITTRSNWINSGYVIVTGGVNEQIVIP